MQRLLRQSRLPPSVTRASRTHLLDHRPVPGGVFDEVIAFHVLGGRHECSQTLFERG